MEPISIPEKDLIKVDAGFNKPQFWNKRYCGLNGKVILLFRRLLPSQRKDSLAGRPLQETSRSL